IAEHAGDSSPDGMQHLLSRAAWDADAVRDDIRQMTSEHLGCEDAMLVVDETGDVKKGEHTVGRCDRAGIPEDATFATKTDWPSRWSCRPQGRDDLVEVQSGQCDRSQSQ